MKKNKISSEEVKKIANLARLELSTGEIEKFTSQLSGVIDYNIEKLNKVDTQKVEPLLNVSSLSNVYREDNPETGLNNQEALRNASETHNGFFKVKAILENES